jgi:hypothetical protein
MLTSDPNNLKQLPKDYIDLYTVEKKLKQGDYSNLNEFVNDMRGIWKRVCSLMQDNQDTVKKANELSALFENLIKEIDSSFGEN